jgi:hypothetical protein
MDFTSLQFPFMTRFFQELQTAEGHTEPADESVKSNVVDYDHPLLSESGLKNTLNQNRQHANSKEELLTEDIKPKVLTDIIKAAYKSKFPIEILIYALDNEKKLDTRSDAGDAQSLIDKIKGYVPELNQILGRQPFNSEVMMAYMLDSASQVKTLLDKAQNEPYEKASPVGSKFDQQIFYKLKVDDQVIRKNKEVVQYFTKRMQVGQNVFPHLPFDIGRNSL